MTLVKEFRMDVDGSGKFCESNATKDQDIRKWNINKGRIGLSES